ncbi:calcium-binding protein [Roseovarius sp. A46]|uniref:EF-hand domain-containing protein n=1 Tax=Roseovarius sp. A46 TaxID=2109331 RepID=UPI001010FFE8|nr:EF-hand domain-containing protein [Roseovarius sp. A46]RXV58794.1 calcium-binding protein [Roseovarius sp. A46]
MTKTTLATGFALTLALPSIAQAAEFTSADADGDGYVTMSEFQEAMPEATADAFMEADANADGTLSEEEFAAAQDAGVLPSSEG